MDLATIKQMTRVLVEITSGIETLDWQKEVCKNQPDKISEWEFIMKAYDLHKKDGEDLVSFSLRNIESMRRTLIDQARLILRNRFGFMLTTKENLKLGNTFIDLPIDFSLPNAVRALQDVGFKLDGLYRREFLNEGRTLLIEVNPDSSRKSGGDEKSIGDAYSGNEENEKNS